MNASCPSAAATDGRPQEPVRPSLHFQLAEKPFSIRDAKLWRYGHGANRASQSTRAGGEFLVLEGAMTMYSEIRLSRRA